MLAARTEVAPRREVVSGLEVPRAKIAAVTAEKGGLGTFENITLHCRPHNVYQAEKDFGVVHMQQFRA